MINISRISDDSIKFKQHKGQMHFKNNLGEGLSEYRLKKYAGSENIELLYNGGNIVVVVKNVLDWSISHHERFCEFCNAICIRVEKTETIAHHDYSLRVYYWYVPKFYDEKMNELLSVDFENLRL